jgi:hypothetical protein
MAPVLAPVLTPIEESVGVTCAVEVFLATALLHREYTQRQDFTIQEIVNRVVIENIYGSLRAGINVHASQHCVANKPPNPAKHKMLFATGKHTRRLVLPNDEAHPDRTGKIFPDSDEIPDRYQPLLDWAKDRFEKALQSLDFWAEDATERVRQLRSDSLVSMGYVPEQKTTEPRTWLGELLKLRLAGAHLADGVDPDEHIRQLREGWD